MKEKGTINILKFLFALGIVALHSGFLLETKYGFYIHTVLFRLGVPFFFICSGYFVGNINKTKFSKYMKKIIPTYLLLSIFYLIVNMLRFDSFTAENIINGVWYILIGKSQSIMWYVGALITSTIILLHLNNKKKLQIALIISLILYIIGLSFNTYAFLIKENSFKFLYDFLIQKFENNSNAFFLGFLFVGIGYYIRNYYKGKDTHKNKIRNIILLIIGFAILIAEVNLIKKHIDLVSNYEYYLSHLIIIPCLFSLSLSTKLVLKTDYLRKISTYIYYFHYAIIIFLIKLRDSYNFVKLNNPKTFYFITVVITIIISTILYIIKNKIKEKRECLNGQN